MNITATNLNLFVAFDALVSEQSVSRAAKRVGVTQPAMSSALRQLRALLNDPLFVRTSRGISPTPRAIELATPVREGLRLLESALVPRGFDPATARRTFVLAASDYVELVLLPPLLHQLGRRAPHVRLEIRPWGRHHVPESLARGEADLMIGFYGKLPPHHLGAALFEERYACMVRARHPVVRGRLTLATYASLGHIMVSESPGARSNVDRALAERGHTREIALRVSHVMNVPALVASTDYVAAVSRRVAERFAKTYALRLFEPPFKLPPDRVAMAWHDAVDADPGHTWIRGLLAEVSADV